MNKYIEINICISGHGLSPDKITEKLRQSPTSIKKNAIDETGELVDVWYYTIRRESCLSLSDAFDDLISVFESKKEEIIELNDKYKADTFILVITDIINDELPEMTIPVRASKFAFEIRADIDFDIYSY